MNDVENLVSKGAEVHWYGPGIASLVLDSVHGKQREFYNFYGGKCAIEDVHNHRGDLSSTILKGLMRNHIYSVEEKPGAPYCMYRGKCVSACSAGKNFCCNFQVVTPSVEIHEITYFDTGPGESYYMDWQQFHWVELMSENVISHVQFGPVVNDVPTLIRNISNGESCMQGPGSAIDDGVPSNRPSEQDVWDIIEQVVAA